jgi:hypothetical protein
MTQSQSMPGLVFCAFHSCYTGNHEARLFQKLPEQKGLAEGMAQVVEYMSSKHEDLNLIFSTGKKKKKKKEEEEEYE